MKIPRVGHALPMLPYLYLTSLQVTKPMVEAMQPEYQLDTTMNRNNNEREFNKPKLPGTSVLSCGSAAKITGAQAPSL